MSAYSQSASALLVSTHGCKDEDLQAPYFVSVHVFDVHNAPILHLPAVVDDFGDLVIVGGPL